MKIKQLFPAIALVILLSIMLSAVAQRDKDNGKGNHKEHKQEKGQGKDKKPGKRDENALKDNQGKNQGKGNDQGGRGFDKDDNDRGNAGKSDKRRDKDNGDNPGKGKHNSPAIKDNGFVWDRETFKDRKNIRKQDKVTICHKVNGNNGTGVTLKVSANALKAHLNHGDVEGDCPELPNSTISADLLRTTTNYYTTLQNSQEQVIYSRSILDYALERLTGARTQLVVMEKRNLPLAEIEKKKQVVVELEQNVSALEAVLGVTAALVAEKWKD